MKKIADLVAILIDCILNPQQLQLTGVNMEAYNFRMNELRNVEESGDEIALITLRNFYLNWIRQLPTERILEISNKFRKVQNLNLEHLLYYDDENFSKLYHTNEFSEEDFTMASIGLLNAPTNAIKSKDKDSLSEKINQYNRKVKVKNKSRLNTNQMTELSDLGITLKTIMGFMATLDPAAFTPFLHVVEKTIESNDFRGLKILKTDIAQWMLDMTPKVWYQLDEALLTKTGKGFFDFIDNYKKLIKGTIRKKKIDDDDEYRLIKEYLDNPPANGITDKQMAILIAAMKDYNNQ